jgi:hypothetical protein
VFNIARQHVDTSALQTARCTQPAHRRAEAVLLLDALLAHDPSARLSARCARAVGGDVIARAHRAARRHPLMWSASTRLAFVGEASDRIEADIACAKTNAQAAKETSSYRTHARTPPQRGGRRSLIAAAVEHDADVITGARRAQRSGRRSNADASPDDAGTSDGWVAALPAALIGDAISHRQYQGYDTVCTGELILCKQQCTRFVEIDQE